MSRCERFERERDAASANDLAALHAHADACADCDAARRRRVAYDEVVGRAVAALDAEGELSAAAWVRVRDGVEAAASPRRAWGWAWPVGIAAAGALAFVLVGRAQVEAPRVALSPSAPLASTSASPEGVAQAAPTLAAVDGPDHGDPQARPGEHLRTGAEARTVVAFGRHVLTLAPETDVEVVDWSPRAMVLRLRRGALDCDVARASADERFEVRSEGVRVRVLGTRFTVAVEGDGATGVSVEHGLVEVADAGGSTRLAAGQWDRFGGALSRVAPSGAPEVDSLVPGRAEAPAPASAGSSREPRGRRAPAVELIDIEVPDQRMERPAPEPPAATPPAPGGIRLIEIEVPPQRAE
ncbi:MAG: FecR domain-containing protein [Deltaproteobacteria bacterium]|nr:FecR domain-containing protein [Deltaproteobacteria bacterium]